MSELAIISSLQELVVISPITIAIAVFAARWLILAFIPLAVFLLVRDPASRHAVSEAVWSFLLALLVTTLLASLIQRPRPFLAAPDPSAPMIRLIPPPYNTSFPSGHTASSVAIAAALFYVNRRIGFVAVALAALVALGRIMVGVHYPTDILGGLVVGLLSFFVIRFLHAQLRSRDLNLAAERHRHTP